MSQIITVKKYNLENILESLAEVLVGKTLVDIHIQKEGLLKSKIELTVKDHEVSYVPQYINVEKKVIAKKPGSTSIYYCVYYDKSKNSWAYKFTHQKRNYLKTGFKNERDAALAYNEHVVKVKGANAILNDVGA